tara:strand:+ start:285 stop:740 length:456 start_codon:yes stop_codon:yes gene_type:complete
MTFFSNRMIFFLLVFATPMQSLETFAVPKWVSLEIVNREGITLIIETEIADTEEARILGLSTREALGVNEGFLLDFGKNIRPRMWMKNTRFSLDMLFIDSFGRIRFIYPQAVPLSLGIISPDVEVRYVLEILGGQSERLGIEVGNKVRRLP